MHQVLADFLKNPADMAVRATIGRFEKTQIPDPQISVGMISYDIEGRLGRYQIRFMHPEAWSSIPAENFLGRVTSQCLFEQRGKICPDWNPTLVEFVTEPLLIWNILVCFKFEPTEKEVLDKDLLNEMLGIVVERFKNCMR